MNHTFSFVSATRKSADEFQTGTALGKSIERIAYDNLKIRVATDNTRGLPTVFNEILDQVPDDEFVIFVHDDVWIDDYYLTQRVVEGLEQFDIIGLAGNRRRRPHQPAWNSTERVSDWDDPRYLSGRVAHGPEHGGPVTLYGAAPAPCELLDGVFLAARRSTLSKHDLRFDPRFDFHYYDLDFCRTARQKGLRLGTWPICITHVSTPRFEGPSWQANREKYFLKWGD